MPSGSRVAMRSGARSGVSGIRLLRVEVRVVLEKVVAVVVGLAAVGLGGFLVVLRLRGRGGCPVVVVDGVAGAEDGFVLVVVDHHAADHAAHGVSHHLLLARVELRLLGDYCTACSRQRLLEALRWGRNNGDGGESLGEESGGCVGARQGGHVWVRVRVRSRRLGLFSPSQGWRVEAPELLRAPLWVTIVVPGPVVDRLSGLRRQCAAIAAGGHFGRSSRGSGEGGVMVKQPILSRGALQGLAGLGVSAGSCRRRRGLVHHLVLSRRPSAFVAHRRPILGVWPRSRAEGGPRLAGKMQIKGIESRVPLQEVVDLGLQTLGHEGGLVLRRQVHVFVKSLDERRGWALLPGGSSALRSHRQALGGH